MCDRGCGKVLKGSKLGKVFPSLKERGTCEESRSHKCVHQSLLRGCAWRHVMKLPPGELLGDSLQRGLSAYSIFVDSPSKDMRVSMV